MRRLFARWQKRHLYVAAQGRCERCGFALGERWDAHHDDRHADGGVTELNNALALCGPCHKDIHMKHTDSIKPRGWQTEAISRFWNGKKRTFLLEATPGAGKTIFSGLCARRLLDNNEADFCVIVVPTTAIKGDRDAGFLGDWHKVGLQLTTKLLSGQGRPKQFRGGVVTYQQLPNMIETLRTWADNGTRLFVVFDEVHHASPDNAWGAASEALGEMATRVLAMTGTAFRADGRRIAFVQYDASNRVVPDWSYSYREAVADGVCRRVEFMVEDSTVTYTLNGTSFTVKASECAPEDVGTVSAVMFQPDSDWHAKVIRLASSRLEEHRTVRPNAGGICITRGGSDENDERMIERIAKTIRRETSRRPVVIMHEDPDANAKIERFRKSSDEWLCSIRKVSEGVDVRRLSVMVMGNSTNSELLFRQLLGRVLRAEADGEFAVVYIPAFPHLVEMAKRISEEAEAGLRDRREREARERINDPGAREFMPGSDEHASAGAISEDGLVLSIDSAREAQHLKSLDRSLGHLPVTLIARVLAAQAKATQTSETADHSAEPAEVERRRLRDDINRMIRRIARHREIEHKILYGRLFREIGVRDMDDMNHNASLNTMNRAIEILRKWEKSDESAA